MRILIAAILCVVLVMAGFPAHAKTSVQIAGVNDSYWSEVYLPDVAMLSSGSGEDLLDLYVQPGETLLIVLPPEAFVDAEGYPLEGYTLPFSRISEARVGVQHKVIAGAQTLAGVSLVSDPDFGASILVEFQPEFVQTQELEFEYDIYVTIRGKRETSTRITIAGKIANPVVYVYDGDDYVDLSDGYVAEATAYIKDIELYLGNGLSLRRALFKGSRYYGIATVEQSDTQSPLLPGYPEVELVYTLRTIGLKREDRDTVTFDFTELYYVYNQEGQYIGTTSKILPYSAKYYLTRTQIGSIDVPEDL
jgi:hypothetical protein